MKPGKFGRRPFTPTDRTVKSGDILARALAPLGTPPALSTNYTSDVSRQSPGGWGILGNDQYGCCVESAEGHFLMQRTANAGTIVIPTAEEVLALYTAETGFTPSNPNSDQGTSMASDALYMCSTGLLGHKADATGWVNPANLANLQWCIQLFGGIGLGVNLPQSALDQFNANQAWAVVADDGGIVGGHDIFASKYDGSFVYCITWAELVAVTPEWILKYADEAHGLVFLDWIEATGVAPSGLNLVQLVADLQQLSVPQGGGPKRQHRHWRRRQRQRQAERDSTTNQ